jgi:hypothetical protein
MDFNTIKIQVLAFAAVIVAFFIGRVTGKTVATDQLSKEYAQQYSAKVEQIRQESATELQQKMESFKKTYEETAMKVAVVDEKITTKPDGTKIVERKKTTKSKKVAKKVETADVATVTDKSKTTQEVAKQEIQQSVVYKEVVKVQTPSWHVYAAAGVSSKSFTSRSYGGGFHRSLGPLLLGGQVTYNSHDSSIVPSVTLGVSF